MPVAAAIVGSAVIGAGASLLGSNKAASVSKQNNNANAALERENRARNEALISDLLNSNTDRLTQGRDAAVGLAGDSRLVTDTLAEQGRGTLTSLYNDLSTRNVGELQANLRHVQANATDARDTNAATLRETRDASLGYMTEAERQAAATRDASLADFNQAEQRNETDITGYSGRAEGAIKDATSANEALFDPYVQSGARANSALQAMLGLTGDATEQEAAFQRFRDSSGYQFQVNEAERGTLAGSAATGSLESGAAAKALQDRRQNIANTTSDRYLDRLAGQQGVGLTAAGGLASSRMSGANGLASVYQNTASQLTGNRNGAAAGRVGAQQSYGSAYGAVQGAKAGIAQSYGAGNVNNTNTFADRMGNSWNTYLDGITATNRDQTAGLVGANTNYFNQRQGAAADYYTNTANLFNNTARDIASLNTGATSALVGGNNAMTSSLTQGNSVNGTNQANAALANASMIANLAGQAGNAFAYYGGAPRTAQVPRTTVYGPPV